jgi:hypothetical protein
MSLLFDVRENLGSVYEVALLAAGGVVVVGAKPDKYSTVAEAYRFLSPRAITIPLLSFQ